MSEPDRRRGAPGAQASAAARLGRALEREELVLALRAKRLTCAVIAERLGYTESAVKSLLVRANRRRNGT